MNITQDPDHVFEADECQLIVMTYCDVPPAFGACHECSGTERCRLRRMALQAAKYANLMRDIKHTQLFPMHPPTKDQDI